jgi:hypothetical protein
MTKLGFVRKKRPKLIHKLDCRPSFPVPTEPTRPMLKVCSSALKVSVSFNKDKQAFSNPKMKDRF